MVHNPRWSHDIDRGSVAALFVLSSPVPACVMTVDSVRKAILSIVVLFHPVETLLHSLLTYTPVGCGRVLLKGSSARVARR